MINNLPVTPILDIKLIELSVPVRYIHQTTILSSSYFKITSQLIRYISSQRIRKYRNHISTSFKKEISILRQLTKKLQACQYLQNCL